MWEEKFYGILFAPFQRYLTWKALQTLFLNFASCLMRHNVAKRTTLFNPGVGYRHMQSPETKHSVFPQTHINRECSSNGN